LAIGIERKFIPLGESRRAGVERSVRMAQGDLNDQGAGESGRQRSSARVRIAGDQAFLNLKSREAGRSRKEFDYAIPLADAEALLALCRAD
jgi:adenylate cyclase